MSYIKNIISEEQDRLNDLLKLYLEKHTKLPKGSLVERNISGKSYVYLHYRENGKVISKYLGKKDSQIHKDLILKINQRKDLEQKIKKVKNEIREIKKINKP